MTPNNQIAAASVALASLIVASTTAGSVAQKPVYTPAATQSCLTALPNAVAGLPPTTPPVPPRLFIYSLVREDVSTWGVGQPRPRAHRQLGVWYGGRRYEGIILSFFKSVDDARTSLKTLAWLYGGTLARNVVVTWDQKPMPSRNVRDTVLGCLRYELIGQHAANGRRRRRHSQRTRAVGEGTPAGCQSRRVVGAGNRGHGCCTREYELTFQILSVAGTLTRATAVYRVTYFKRYDAGVRRLHTGDVGKLVLKDGIVTNTLTDDFFCSDPAWGATGACGA